MSNYIDTRGPVHKIRAWGEGEEGWSLSLTCTLFNLGALRGCPTQSLGPLPVVLCSLRGLPVGPEMGKQALLGAACGLCLLARGSPQRPASRPCWALACSGSPQQCLLGSCCWGDATSTLPWLLWVPPSLSLSDG
uniref:Uncharacterized protein n=1 Tax=Myotis myotis TaxID=51298 RepID=A0A7J7ZXX8_MYOMY|nr:hypothetical protein mMyoMyo1_009851 [Myotis myotis]